MADGAGPQKAVAKRKRDPSAKVRIRRAMDAEIAATVGLTKLGFELLSRAEQLKRIKRRLGQWGVPASEIPTMRQIRDFMKAQATANEQAAKD